MHESSISGAPGGWFLEILIGTVCSFPHSVCNFKRCVRHWSHMLNRLGSDRNTHRKSKDISHAWMCVLALWDQVCACFVSYVADLMRNRQDLIRTWRISQADLTRHVCRSHKEGKWYNCFARLCGCVQLPCGVLYVLTDALWDKFALWGIPHKANPFLASTPPETH